MRFIIHGAGAVGSLVGGRLAESGAEAVLIARHPHAAAINRNGLLIKSRAGDRHLQQSGKPRHHNRQRQPRGSTASALLATLPQGGRHQEPSPFPR